MSIIHFDIFCREANGRTFEFRVKDSNLRNEFITAINKAIERNCTESTTLASFGLEPGQSGFDLDDVLSSTEQAPSAVAIIKDEGAVQSARGRLRRIHSNHETGEDEYLDVADFDVGSDDEDDQSGSHSPGDSKEVTFYKCARRYVTCMNSLDAAWTSICHDSQIVASANTPVSSPAVSPSVRKSPGKASALLKSGNSSPTRGSMQRNPILAIKSVPLCSQLDFNDHENSLRAILQCDPDGDYITTLDDLYACAQLAKPVLDELLQRVAEIVRGKTAESVEGGNIEVQSRLLMPFAATDCLQRCSVHSSFSVGAAASTATGIVPSDASFIPPHVIPESCLSNIVSASVTCGSIEQVALIVEELQQAAFVIFLDNRFHHPLGQPPVTDTRSLAAQAVFYDGSYHRDIRLLVLVQYDPEEDSGFQCEVLITLSHLRDTQDIAMGRDLADLNATSLAHLEQAPLAPYFTRFRSWCSHSNNFYAGDAEDEEEASHIMSVLYSREICHRVDLLRQITAMSKEDYTTAIDTFLDDISSEEYAESPLDCEGGYFLQLLQETRAGRDLVAMRSVSSLFFDMELFAGCVALQRDIVEVCRAKYSDVEGGGGSSNALDSLCFELETLASLLMRDESEEEGIYEAIQLLEESINFRETCLQISDQAQAGATSADLTVPQNISSLVSAMLLLASLYEEHGVPSQAITVLLGAQEACIAHPRNEKSLALVLHSLGLLQEEQNSLEEAVASLEDAVEMQMAHFGAGHTVRASTLLDLAAVYLQQGRLDDSLRVGKAAMNARAGSMGGLLMSSPILADAMMALVPIFNAVKQYGESKAHIEKAIAIRSDFYGKKHSSVADCFVEYGMVCRHKGNLEKARQYLEFGLKVSRTCEWFSRTHY